MNRGGAFCGVTVHMGRRQRRDRASEEMKAGRFPKQGRDITQKLRKHCESENRRVCVHTHTWEAI